MLLLLKYTKITKCVHESKQQLKFTFRVVANLQSNLESIMEQDLAAIAIILSCRATLL